MSFINTIPETEVTGKTKEIYDNLQASYGYIPNYARLFSHRPDVYQAWAALLGSIRPNLSLRRYELVTLAAARTMPGSYCMLAHGTVLLKNGFTEDQLIAIAKKDYPNAGLEAQEIAIMEFAEKIINNAASITANDVENLKAHGLSDAEILDITLATTARSFFSKTLDALNAIPDDTYMELSEPLRDALAVGRAFPQKTVAE